ncbi:glycosyl hydrolase 53 family protein [Nocardia sp. NPDC004168]|uniref:glycosyl hydrolase 53 family protein n=1 Tax=Nocardia sp. NPDC004168 TaxID=3154452 RepID=UPI0033B6C102
MRTFVVNLDRDTERLTVISENLARHGMLFERWPATDGRTLDFDRPEQGEVVQDFGRWASLEAACGISHIRLWRHIVDHGIPWAIVLEDDAELISPLPHDVDEWGLPPDCDLVFLSSRATPGRIRSTSGRFSYADLIGGAGTEGYLVGLAGAVKLLQIMTPLKDPLDFQMYAHAESVQRHDAFPYFWKLPINPAAAHVRLDAYRLVPDVVRHTGAESSIGNSRHPRARFYCRLLLGLDFADGGYGSGGYTNIRAESARHTGDFAARRPSRHVTDFFHGVDLSHCPGGRAYEVATTLADHGVNSVRLSVWVDDNSPMNLEHAIGLAQAARSAGLAICLTLHYSDTWADPGKQCKPRAWASLPIRTLIEEVRRYTAHTLTEFRRHDIQPAMVQVGNEITNGMLWAEPGQDPRSGARLHPEDGVESDWNSADQWVILSELLRAATMGVRETADSTLISVHLDRGADVEGAEWWLRYADHFDVDYDAVSLSFYPLAHHDATISRLRRIESLCASRPHKSVLIGETAYPFRPIAGNDRTYTDIEREFSFDARGQHEYLRSALRTIGNLSTGCGLFWWGACFIDDSVERSVDYFRAHALFDADWRPLPALSAFKENPGSRANTLIAEAAGPR